MGKAQPLRSPRRVPMLLAPRIPVAGILSEMSPDSIRYAGLPGVSPTCYTPAGWIVVRLQ